MWIKIYFGSESEDRRIPAPHGEMVTGGSSMVQWALWLEVAWVGSCEWESHVLRRTVLLVQTPRYDRVPVLLRYEPFSHALVFLLDPTPAMAHGFEAW